MELKWHPIVDGDLNGIPKDKRLLFTGIDQGELYVDFGYVDSYLERQAMISIGNTMTVKTKEIIAWMEVPEPFEPDECNKCAYRKEWTDEFGDNWFECELLQCDVPPNGKLNDCPLNR